MKRAYPISFIIVGILFLMTAYINLSYEDTSFGTLIFFGFGGIALILEGIKRLKAKNKP